VSADARARRVAVVADSRLEALLPELQRRGFGVIQLPPAGLPADVAAEWLEQVADHVSEFLRTGYEVVVEDDGAYDLAQYAIQPPSTSRFVPET
jgi:hypothetical protein